MSTTEHRITWYVYADGVKMRRTAAMRGTWGHDVECSCGWKTMTGGATRTYVADEVRLHKMMESE